MATVAESCTVRRRHGGLEPRHAAAAMAVVFKAAEGSCRAVVPLGTARLSRRSAGAWAAPSARPNWICRAGLATYRITL